MKQVRNTGLFLLVFLTSFSIFSQKELKRTEQLIKDKKYQEAIVLFENYLKTDSTNSSVYFNIASCYFYQEQYGMAVWAFEKSLKYNPIDKDAVYNLEVCYQKLKKTQPWKASASGMERALYARGEKFWTWFSILSSLLLFSILYFFYTSKNQGWKKVYLFSGVLMAAITGVSIYLKFSTENYYRDSDYLVVLTKSIPVYSNEVAAKQIGFSLLEGDKVKIISEDKKYYKIELENKEICQIEKTGTAKI